MGNLINSFLAINVMLIILQHNLVVSLSPLQQKTALFQFKESLNIGTPTNCSYYSYSDYYESRSHPKMMNWSMSWDHCTWEGVSCENKTGDVIGLDLSYGQLEGAILPNSTLFQLSHLQFLNLSWNDFSLTNQFPQEFGYFVKGLTHLNLSYTRFSGRVPSGISHLHKLVSLDLSDNYVVKLQYEVFKSLLQNLTQLRVLNLKSVVISSVLPMNLSTSLTVLNLENTDLYGILPQEVFHLPNLETLVLSSYANHLKATRLRGVLPKVEWGSNGSLQHLYLNTINIYGGIPDSIGFLESLTTLALYRCNLSGPIPRSIGNLGQLTYLGLGGNNLNGLIPTVLANLTNLKILSLYDNNFKGPLPSRVSQLTLLVLRNNSLTGPLPPWLFDHPSLEHLDLSDNRFTDQLHEFDSSKSHLKFFDCNNNLLHGPIPQSFSQLVNLTELHFSSNNFSGVLDIKMFSRLEYLQYLDLSHNSLSVTSTSMATLPPKLNGLSLASCNMKEFPHFSRDAEISLDSLDLSNNGWSDNLSR